MATTKEALQQEELRLIAALSAVRSQLNDFTPISSLPPEVLEYIFSICVLWLYDPRKQAHRLAWAQVCRKWRCVSLNAARLWRSIDLCNAPLASECLLRSASAPIHLIANVPCLKLSVDTLLPPHAQNIQSMDVHLFPEDLMRLFESCGPELPALTSLALKVPPVSSNFTLDVPMRLPGLRRLALRSVSIPWNMCVGLTRLSLCGLLGGCSPTIEQLSAVLRASPYIEEVNIEYITLTPSGADTSPAAQIPLSYLKHLSIIAKVPLTIYSILSCIEFPVTAKLSIECSRFDHLRDLLPTASGVMHPLRARAIQLDRNGFRLAFEPAAEPIISLRVQEFPIDLEGLLTDLPAFFDLSEVTVLRFGYLLPVLTEEYLIAILSHLPTLEGIDILNLYPLNDSLLALTKPVAQQGLLCQKLKRIWFGETFDVDWTGFIDDSFLLLREFTKLRREAGKPVDIMFENPEYLSAFLNSSK
ncbi:hypothetical protein DXG01_009660 [Tephrocybe rancida]|nr:hypothetical protein DXG01_009660 [Tephrocybe rancida]